MLKLPLVNEYGLTVKQLKKYIADWPEKNEYGVDYEVWICDDSGTSNQARGICRLNEGDIIIEF